VTSFCELTLEDKVEEIAIFFAGGSNGDLLVDVVGRSCESTFLKTKKKEVKHVVISFMTNFLL